MTHYRAYLLTHPLSVGAHPPDGESCVMERVAQLRGGPWTDHPAGVDPSIAAYCRVLNDRGPDWVRGELLQRVEAISRARKLPYHWIYVWAEAARQSAIRALGPKRRGDLAALPPITDHQSAAAAARAARAVYADAAAAAYAAARAAAAEWKIALALLDRAIAEAEP